MRKLTGMTIAFLLSVLPAITAADQPTDPLAGLHGKWKFVDVEGGGEKKPKEHFEEATVNIVGNEFWVSKPTGNDPKFRILLESGKNTFDLECLEGKDKGQIIPGIYSFKDGQFRFCINIFGNPRRRPADFTTHDGDGTAYAILKQIDK